MILKYLPVVLCTAFGSLLAAADANHGDQPLHAKGLFRYEKAHAESQVTWLGDKEYYDSSITQHKGKNYIALLKFRPGKGDQLYVAELTGGKLLHPKILMGFHQFKNPTLTSDGEKLYLSLEIFEEEQWNIHVMTLDNDFSKSGHIEISTGGGNINHDVVAHPDGGLSIVWQKDIGGQFDVVYRRVQTDLTLGPVKTISACKDGDWHPRIAINPKGKCFIVWDSFNGKDFDVVGRWLESVDSGIIPIAGGPTTQFRADLSFIGEKLYVLWEEAAANWGRDYEGGFGHWNDIQDHQGPLHKFRLIKTAKIEKHKAVLLNEAFPMDVIAQAQQQPDKRENLKYLGIFYERGQFVVDGQQRLWLVHRAYYAPHVRTEKKVAHHIESGWQVQARCYNGEHWSKLFSFNVNQRDGLQRLSLSPKKDGFSASYTAGRTHRDAPSGDRGVYVGEISMKEWAENEQTMPEEKISAPDLMASARQPVRDQTTLAGEEYVLSFGDLHRHTDISLCFPFFDGSYDDNFRYIIEVVDHDFVGITDHTRDVSNGDVNSQLWWRSLKEVTRHRLKGKFIPYFSYERSQRETDHNVISLRDDMLRPFEPPLQSFWDQLDEDTFTIPHNTGGNIKAVEALWSIHDDVKRPLFEIYQGCRKDAGGDMQKVIRTGLDKGYHFGFIASSDHLSTHKSYACVWSPQREKVSIFRSMQARRTYGATDRIGLVFKTGDHWMGEIVSYQADRVLELELSGTAAIKSVKLIHNGKEAEIHTPKVSTKDIKHEFKLRPLEREEDYYFVEVLQEDGNQAWSSPIWFKK